jgi:aminoglycoside 3-N-acetyltransferase
VTSMGILPELARRHPQAVRTCHPTNSIVALGKHARALTESHCYSIYPCGEESPYYKIVSYDGWIVGLGVSTANLSFVHCIEDIWRDRFPVRTRTTEVFAAQVLNASGTREIVQTLAQSRVTQMLGPRSVPNFIRRYVPKDVCRDVTIQGVNYFTAKARPLYAELEELAGQGITIYGAPARPTVLWAG